jgi:ribonucleotide monophosphatase NagD (HAD superfamily)
MIIDMYKLTYFQNPGRFGFLLDIDGVICRGRDILPGVREAFNLLTDSNGKFRVPTVFLTNASNSLRASKAERLSELLQLTVKLFTIDLFKQNF